MVDIYSEWSGPCTAMQTALKKIKLEVNHDDHGESDDDKYDYEDDENEAADGGQRL